MGPDKALWHGIHAGLEHAIDALAQPGLNEEASNEAGTMWSGSPGDLAQLMRLYQAQAPEVVGPAASFVAHRGMIGRSAPGAK